MFRRDLYSSPEVFGVVGLGQSSHYNILKLL